MLQDVEVVAKVETVILVEKVLVVAEVDTHSVHTASVWDTPKIRAII